MRKFNDMIRQVARLPDLRTVIKLQPNGIEVAFPNGRSQMVTVDRQGERYTMTSVVLGHTRVESLGRTEILQRIWLRNRQTNIVAFDLDGRGRLVGRIEQIAETLDVSELAFYIQFLARECDQFECILSGQDVQ